MEYRNAHLSDLPEIVAIYNSTVAGRMVTADTEEVTVSNKRKWFEAHHERRPLWMAYSNQQLVGWISFQDFYGRPAYNGTAEISIYLAPEQRGKGFGKKMLQYAIEKAPSLHINNLIGIIFAHNAPSLQLFLQLGFERWGHLPEVAVMDGNLYSVDILGLKLPQ
jgi:phosphinothricin acetyltransferase